MWPRTRVSSRGFDSAFVASPAGSVDTLECHRAGSNRRKRITAHLIATVRSRAFLVLASFGILSAASLLVLRRHPAFRAPPGIGPLVTPTFASAGIGSA
jgi:hypothetical protein